MIGKFPAKLDDKNRLIVPSRLREQLGDTFYVTVGVNCGHRCLTVYTADRWRDMEQRYDSLSVSEKASPTSVLFICATECVPDKQFRFSLTPSLMHYAGISREVLIVGRAGQAEIWDAGEYDTFERDALTPEKLLASLEAIGL